ncbi:MAG: metal ABC transporter permease [Planctomycetes bacterium]|jgi:manganese/iron transport system permease protein|nr:metal ABC transporter permease [Planctomycetota bacterium]
MLDFAFWAPVFGGGLVAGASGGLLSVYIVGMRIPFIGVCVAHAALAGAVFGSLAGLSGHMLMLPAMGGAMAMSLALGLADPRRVRMDANIVMGLLFSITMGLAFLGFGLFGVLGKNDAEVRSLLWGSPFCSWGDVRLMAAVAVGLALFVIIFAKEMRAILFSRTEAQAAGIRATGVWTGFLILTAAVLTVNFQTVGGLMIYSLISNPAAAAFQLVRGNRNAIALSMLFGAASGFGGFAISAMTDLPAGAVIVLVSSFIVMVAAIIGHFAHKFRRPATDR